MSNKDQYIIVDIINKEFFKDENWNTKIFDSLEDAQLYCSICELDNAWICKLMYNHIENEQQ